MRKHAITGRLVIGLLLPAVCLLAEQPSWDVRAQQARRLQEAGN